MTHASPAGTYAHIAHRDWEADTNMEEDKINSTMYDDIAEQLILREPGIKFNVSLIFLQRLYLSGKNYEKQTSFIGNHGRGKKEFSSKNKK